MANCVDEKLTLCLGIYTLLKKIIVIITYRDQMIPDLNPLVSYYIDFSY